MLTLAFEFCWGEGVPQRAVVELTGAPSREASALVALRVNEVANHCSSKFTLAFEFESRR